MTLQEQVAKLPQLEVETLHYFADGMYARRLTQPMGSVVVGKIHRKEHFYVVCKGTMRVTTDSGVKDITGPEVIVSSPGTKRAILALTDVTYLTVHKVSSTNLEAIELELIEPEDGSLFDAYNRLKVPQITEAV